MIQAIIFDLWETIATKNVGISKTLREHFGIPKTDDFTHRYEAAIQLTAWDTEEEMATNFLRAFTLDETPEAIAFVVETLNRGIQNATLFKGMQPLLVELHKKAKLGLLSNTTVFESQAISRLGIADLFDATFFSWEIGSLKPSEQNFTEILSRLGAEASQSLFVDDGIKNVEAARTFGLQAIQFHTVESLQKELNKLGLL